jgi:hypothetical protein
MHRSKNSALGFEVLIIVRTLPPTPKTISLYPNFPNPFNASTTIRYDLPIPGEVSLNIYDALGRETATLISEHEYAGEHSVQWDAANVPSGIYLVRLRVDGFTQTQKMILAR